MNSKAPQAQETLTGNRKAPSQAFNAGSIMADWFAYQIDFWQRSVLYIDTLRQRAENMLEHERAGKPALLDFDYEVIIDGRRLSPAANYELLKITRVGDKCLQDCLDDKKPPVLIIDPRAGHGPGIGGFKRASEVGMALHEGHPVYFASFFPEPVKGQTLENVLYVLHRFIEELTQRHPGKPPVVYGNCQAGWVAALLSADCEGLVGPAVLNGSPLSYWSGESGVNPMRLAGGLLGGAWLAHLVSDLGDGRFDGANLVANFESLKPAHTLWQKDYQLFSNIDSQRKKFLDFERWWTGFYMLSKEEITATVSNLFIGNKLERGEYQVCPGCYVDLRRIRNPLVIFASSGDNITPPHQALNWIPAIYPSTDALKKAGQRIVYLLHSHAGHLGIFVSAKVARLEHRAILESLAELDNLAPGLYQMKIDNPTGDPDRHKPQYDVHFEERQVEEINYPHQTPAFELVRNISEANVAIYESVIGPWVRLFVTPWSAEMMRQLHPARTSRLLYSERFMPWMTGIKGLAQMVEAGRLPSQNGNVFREQEAQNSKTVTQMLELAGNTRDTLSEMLFRSYY